MKKEIADRWVARLRSGQDEQGPGALNFGGRKCCLGVLCEIAVEDGIVLSRRTEGPRNWYDGADTLLPASVVDWAKMASNDGDLGGVRQNLACLNDEEGRSFEYIADVIEAEWEKL